MWKKSKKGFTLIELVVVIVILGILAAVAIPKYIDLSDKAEDSACKANRGVIASACALRYSSNAASGSPAWPSSHTDTTLYADDTVPSCPASGSYTYDDAGRVTCSIHGK